MVASKPRQFSVRRPDQLDALRGALPHRIVAALERLGACSVRELADAIGEQPEDLYYHVRKLHRAELLVDHGPRDGLAGGERVYELPGTELMLDSACGDPAFIDALAESVAALLRLVSRQARAALGSSRTRRGGRRRNFVVHRHDARLSPGAVEELNRRLESIAAYVASHDDPSREDWVSLTIVLCPASSGRASRD